LLFQILAFFAVLQSYFHHRERRDHRDRGLERRGRMGDHCRFGRQLVESFGVMNTTWSNKPDAANRAEPLVSFTLTGWRLFSVLITVPVVRRPVADPCR
jgi:hypothetical protein